MLPGLETALLCSSLGGRGQEEVATKQLQLAKMSLAISKCLVTLSTDVDMHGCRVLLEDMTELISPMQYLDTPLR